MADSYLDLAKVVLETRARPMSAQQILDDARRHDLLPNHLSGETMSKTLQARIAEDIFNNRSGSIFYRTSIGTYFLRSLSGDVSLPKKVRKEFKPSERKRPLPRERILFFENGFGFSETAFLSRVQFDTLPKRRNSYHFIDDEPPGAYRVLTFTVVSRGDDFLKHRIGKHSHFSDLIGMETIGFRRYIDEFDLDLFSGDKLGVDLNSAREVLRNIGSSDLSVDDRSIREKLHRLGAVVEPVFTRLSLVVRVDLSELKEFSRQLYRRLDVNEPAWTIAKDLRRYELDQPSKTVLDRLFEK